MAAGIRLLLVDGLNLVRRVYAAQPGEDGPDKARDGRIASRQSLERALRETAPTHALVVFEGPEPTWRHEKLPEYKAGHKPMPEALREELPRLEEDFAELGVRSFELAGVEADDVIATLAVKTAAAGGTAVLLSTDRIYFQLLSDNIRVRDHFAREDRDREHVLERFGVEPARFVDYLALTGDSTNGIPGVPGIGPKRAAELVSAFPTLEDLLAAATSPSEAAKAVPAKLLEKISGHAEEARLSWSLMHLVTDLDLGLNLRSLRYSGPAEPESLAEV